MELDAGNQGSVDMIRAARVDNVLKVRANRQPVGDADSVVDLGVVFSALDWREGRINIEKGKPLPGGFEKYLADMKVLHPLGIGESDDFAYAVLYLASDESKYMTGSELVIDGGYTAQ